MSNKNIEKMKIKEIKNKYPFALSFLKEKNINIEGNDDILLEQLIKKVTNTDIEFKKIKEDITEQVSQMINFLGLNEDNVNNITIEAGTDKDSKKENFNNIVIKKSEIISIVGPTGSGKSRLLADIEWMADRDTPTKRKILINGKLPDKKKRFSGGSKLVSQLSQNMNFVMDLTVRDFLNLHAESRMVENRKEIISKIIELANELAGEKFEVNTNVTSLSGGQSRALMIADTAILSKSPIVLIDEIENAGIDRKKALDLFVNEEKIVLIATHDPSLALLADKRIVIRNGGVSNIIKTDAKEKEILKELEKINCVVNDMRTRLRSGEMITKLYDK